MIGPARADAKSVSSLSLTALRLFASIALVAAAFASAGCTAFTAKNDPVVVGYLGGLSGRSSGLGLAGRDGALLAVEQANAAGGIDGRKIVLETADDGASATAPAAGLRALVAQGAIAVVGPMTSASASMAAPVAQELGVPLISPTVSSTDFTGKDDMFLRVCSDNRMYANQLAEVLAKGRPAPRAAVVYDLGNESYSRSLYSHFSEKLSGLGGSITTTATFSSGENTDFSALAQQATTGAPDAVFVIANPIDSALMCQRLRLEGYKGSILLAHWAASGSNDLLETGGSSLDGVILLDNYDRESTSKPFTDMVAAFRQRFGSEPSFASIHAYDSMRLVIEAARSGRSDRMSMKRAILKSAGAPFAGLQEDFTLDSNGDTVRRFYPTTIRNGEFVDLSVQ